MKLNTLNKIGVGLFSLYAIISALFVCVITFLNLNDGVADEFSSWMGVVRMIVVPAYVLVACTSKRTIRTIALVSAISAASLCAYDSLNGSVSRLGLPIVMPLAFVFILVFIEEMNGSGKAFGILSAIATGFVWLSEAFANAQLVKDIAPAFIAPHLDEVYLYAAPVMWLLIAITSAIACFGSKK